MKNKWVGHNVAKWKAKEGGSMEQQERRDGSREHQERRFGGRGGIS